MRWLHRNAWIYKGKIHYSHSRIYVHARLCHKPAAAAAAAAGFTTGQAASTVQHEGSSNHDKVTSKHVHDYDFDAYHAYGAL